MNRMLYRPEPAAILTSLGVISLLAATTGCRSPNPGGDLGVKHPTAVRHSRCGARPSACGYPDASNTGVSANMTLRPYGNVQVSADGAIVTRLRVHGTIDVHANNVTIKNTLVENSGASSIGILQRQGYHGLTVESTTVRGMDKTGGEMQYAVKDDGANMTLSKLNLYNCADCVQSASGHMSDSYIHDLGYTHGDHTDGFQSNGGGGVVIRHNTILNSWPQTSAVALFQDFSPQANNVIDNNLLAGGGYTVYGGSGKEKSRNIKIARNRFSRIYYKNCGFYSPVAYFDRRGAGNVWSGNVWDDTGISVVP